MESLILFCVGYVYLSSMWNRIILFLFCCIQFSLPFIYDSIIVAYLFYTCVWLFRKYTKAIYLWCIFRFLLRIRVLLLVVYVMLIWMLSIPLVDSGSWDVVTSVRYIPFDELNSYCFLFMLYRSNLHLFYALFMESIIVFYLAII